MARLDRLVCAAMLALAAASAHAQTAAPVVAVDGKLTVSDNGALGAEESRREELITSIRPELTWVRRRPGYELDLRAAATLLDYANGTQDDNVVPDVLASLKTVVVQRLLFVEAAARVRESEADPFGTRAGESGGANRRTQSSYSLSPSIERELSPNASLRARHDATLTTHGAGSGTRLVSNRSLVRLERKPVPLGAAVELSRLDSRSVGVADSRFTIDAARLRVSMALGEQIVLGAVAGEERSRLLLGDGTDSLHGVTLEWSPGPRTSLSAELEQRFFGRTGGLLFRHRMPLTALELRVSRQPVTSSNSLGVLGQVADVRDLLHAILTTRFPDPTERAALVDAVVSIRGLDTRLPVPVDVVAEYAQLRTVARATWVLLGTRDIALVTLYGHAQRRLEREDAPMSVSGGADADSRQAGGSVQFNRRLTPQVSANALAVWSKIVGLAARAGDATRERSYRLSLTRKLSPRTGVSGGVQLNRFATTVSGLQPYDETLLFVGMSHRF